MNWVQAAIRIPDKPFLTIGEVSHVLGYNRKTINRWVKEGTFPSPILIDGVRRWPAMSIGVWLAWKEHGPKPQETNENDNPVKGK
jgi:predicted DNA-binding transcriptional regulator AlpA